MYISFVTIICKSQGCCIFINGIITCYFSKPLPQRTDEWVQLNIQCHVTMQWRHLLVAGSTLDTSFKLLHEAQNKLQMIVHRQFDAAVHCGDVASVERFFKIFPLIGQHKEGLAKFSKYLCAQVRVQVAVTGSLHGLDLSHRTVATMVDFGNLVPVLCV